MSETPEIIMPDFDSKDCAAVARDLTILQMPELDRSMLTYSVKDLENIISVAKGKFQASENPI